MTQKKISVIIPVYNVEKYLENTINSIINQSIFEDLEVLLIDDGSHDNSSFLIEKFSLDYDNIHGYHKENEGLTFTRNYGIDLATGEYIHFMDADDYIPPNAYEKMYILAKKHHHDIVSGRYVRFMNKRIWRDLIGSYLEKNFQNTIESTTLNECKSLTWDSVVWNKLFKTSFLKENNIKFPYEKITFEDNIFSIEAYAHANSIGFLNQDIYYWRVRENEESLSISNFYQTFFDRIKIMNMVNESMVNNNCSDEIFREKYEKWLTVDLNNMVLTTLTVDEKDQPDFLKMAKQVLELGPYKILNDLNDYYNILFNIVLNEDLSDLKEFQTNYRSENLLEKYGNYDFKKDLSDADLKVTAKNFHKSKNSLIVDINSEIKFYQGDHIDIAARIINVNQIHECEVYDNNKIEIPLKSIKPGLNWIQITENCEGILKENYVSCSLIETINFEDYNLEIGYTIENYMYINKRLKNDCNLMITEVFLDNDYMNFNYISDFNLKKIHLIDQITFDKYSYDVDTGNSFKIPFMDLFKSPLKNWTLKIDDGYNQINVQKCFELFKNQNMISIMNQCEKTNINISHFNEVAMINDLVKKLDKANQKNKMLNSENKKLKMKINKFKSRKIIRVTDKIKKIVI